MPKLLKDMAADAPNLIPKELERLRIQEIGRNWLPDRARVADVARVPEKACDQFSDAIFGAICDAWQEADVLETASDIQQDRTLSAAIHTLRTAKQALTDLNEGQRQELRWPISEIEGGIDRFFEWVLGGTEPIRRRAHRRGRRPGAVANRVCENFVGRLLLAAERSGGRLSLEKNIGKGSLIEALHILRAHLPQDVMPSVPSHSTLQRIKSRVRRRVNAGLESRRTVVRGRTKN
jgi:hypothetical protein